MDHLSITIYSMLLFTFFILLKMLICGDTNDKNLQKIFGGLVVLVCALASNNYWAFVTSIFIGGLIIASEDFMKFLAAVLRTSGDKVADTIVALQLKKVSAEEIETKKIEEIKEINEIEKKSNQESLTTQEEEVVAKENVTIPEENYNDILPKIEDAAIEKIQMSLGQGIERNQSLHELDIIFDGILIDNDKKILKFFEVKAFPKLPLNKGGKLMTFVMADSIKRYLQGVIPTIDRYLEYKSAKHNWKHILTIIVVLNTNSEFKKIKQRINDIGNNFNIVSKNMKVNFVFYNIKNMDLDLESK